MDSKSSSHHSVTGRGFAAWADERLEADLAEAAQMLRRTCLISIGRRYDFTKVASALDFGEAIGGACHTFSPGTVEIAGKIPESRLAPGSEERRIFTDGFSPEFRERFDASEPDGTRPGDRGGSSAGS